MGFSTTPITVEQAKELLQCHNQGEVVSASKCIYFDNMQWMEDIAKAEIKDDGVTIFLTLYNEDFVEYSFVIPVDMPQQLYDEILTKEGE